MAEKKKQHYVPRFYLKRFATCDKKFNLYNIERKSVIADGNSVPYKDQFYEDYFYGEDKVWENKLDDLESKWDKSFSNVIEERYSDIDIENLKEFAVFQYGRTLFQLKQQVDSSAKIVYEMLKMVLANQGNDDSLSLNVAQQLSEKKAEEMTSPAKLLDIFEKIVIEISDLEFKHISFKTKNKLISSDNPIVVINPFLKTNIGFGIIGLVILFPISPEDVCILYDSKIYDKISKISNTCKNDYIVKMLNSLIFVNAYSMLYSKDLFPKQLFSDSDYSLWKENCKSSNVSSFGTNKEGVVAVHRGSIKYDKLPYFFSISPSFNAIAPDYRTPVPRKYDFGYEKKIKEKYTVIPSVLARSKDDIIDDQYIKNYTFNHERYYFLIMKYWGK